MFAVRDLGPKETSCVVEQPTRIPFERYRA
jgi:hypothetical protein